MRRPERVADTLREEIAQIVGYELEDPRLTMVTVTDVRLSDNLRDAQCLCHRCTATKKNIKLALSALRHAAPYVRKQLGLSLNLAAHSRDSFCARHGRRERRTRGSAAARDRTRMGKERKDEG